MFYDILWCWIRGYDGISGTGDNDKINMRLQPLIIIPGRQLGQIVAADHKAKSHFRVFEPQPLNQLAGIALGLVILIPEQHPGFQNLGNQPVTQLIIQHGMTTLKMMISHGQKRQLPDERILQQLTGNIQMSIVNGIKIAAKEGGEFVGNVAQGVRTCGAVFWLLCCLDTYPPASDKRCGRHLHFFDAWR